MCRLFYPHIGGVEKHVLELSKVLIKKGHTITIVTEKFYDKLPKKESFDGIAILRIPVPANEKMKKFAIWTWLLKNMQVIRNADIIHCHDVFFWYLPFRLLFLFKKVYTTFHGYEGNNLPNKRAIFMHKNAEVLSNGNICVGKFLEKWYGTKATFITYGAEKTHVFEHKKTSPRNALFVGRLEEETGVTEYLKAVKIIKDKDILLDVTVLGDGSLYEQCLDYCKKNKLHVTFKGFVKNVDVYLQKSSIVFASRYLGIVEALAHKKYVIAQYNNEIKHDYLVMTPFKNSIRIHKHAEDIAKSIQNYLSNRGELSDKGYKWAKEQTWERLADIYLNLWRA